MYIIKFDANHSKYIKYHGTIVAGMIAAQKPYLKSWQLVFRGQGEMEHISLIIHGAMEQEFIMMYCIVLYLKRLYMMQ